MTRWRPWSFDQRNGFIGIWPVAVSAGQTIEDETGQKFHIKMWNLVMWCMWLTAFWNMITFKGLRSIPSTKTIIARSGNGRTNQPICVLMVDADHENRCMWASDMTVDGARVLAKALTDLADYFESFGGTRK